MEEKKIYVAKRKISDDQDCLICSEPIHIYALGECSDEGCGKNICWKCSLKHRIKLNQ